VDQFAVKAALLGWAVRKVLSGCAFIEDQGLNHQMMAPKLKRPTRLNLFADPAIRRIAGMYNGGRQPRERKSQFARSAMQIDRAVLGVIAVTILLRFPLNGLARQSASGKERGAAQATVTEFPKDVYPDSGFRLPLLKREDLDDEGKKMYDLAVNPNSRTIAGLQGPAGIQLYSPKLANLERQLNQYLRYEAGLSARIRELAILVTAREMNSQFEWTAHEPVALQEGLDRNVVEIIKHRSSTVGLPESDAVIIQLGRQMFGEHRVAADTFARASKLFGPSTLLNLVALMSNYSATASLLAAFDMQLSSAQKPLLPLP
jgi:4-carboxymuconolactone decarboxylase